MPLPLAMLSKCGIATQEIKTRPQGLRKVIAWIANPCCQDGRFDMYGIAGILPLTRARLRVDFHELVACRRLTMVNEAEVADLARQGFDIQLHTHRHRLPENDFEAKQELDDNRAVLAPLTGVDRKSLSTRQPISTHHFKKK